MNSIDIMINEHRNISRLIVVIRKMSLNILNNGMIDYNDFYDVINFVRDYADKYHHGKEEKILFKYMVEECGKVGENMINYGMLLDHDLGRNYIRNLEESVNLVRLGNKDARVDVIANAVGYANLLKDHIEKEDNVAYTYAARTLAKETLEKIEEQCMEFDKNNYEVQEKYLFILNKLENKYK
ncbi:MAG: hemerythrin domain-containing protein [Clostridium sp.]|uniref:hemerythrin domain-containing protein n=1 Tax=Clostridium sp. TaxID=1506 RepID=UPI002FC5C5B1